MNGLEFEGWINRLVDASDFKGLQLFQQRVGNSFGGVIIMAIMLLVEQAFLTSKPELTDGLLQSKRKITNPAMKMVIQASDDMGIGGKS